MAKKVKDEGEVISNLIAKINAATTLDELQSLEDEVLGLYKEEKFIPEGIQAAAGNRYKEIQEAMDNETEVILPKTVKPKVDLSDWTKCTLDQAKAAEKVGKLAGYDPVRGIALISK